MLRQTGDSLAGRFFRHRLLPLSLSELHQINDSEEHDLNKLMERGGYPEPLLSTEIVDSQRWRLQYIDGLIRTDVLDFEKIHDFKAIQLVLQLLQRRVGSPVSYKSIAEHAQISPTTVKNYINIFEALYIVFKVSPYSKNIARSILKEPKIYFYDNGMVIGDEGVKLENFVAVSLLKHVNALYDYKAEQWSLNYLRTKEAKEVDFCLTLNEKAECILEVKNKFKAVSKSINYFHKKYNIPAVMLVKDLKREQTIDNIIVRKADTYLRDLFL